MLLRDRVFDQDLSEFRTVTMGDHPTHHVAAKDIPDLVQVEVNLLPRPRSVVISQDKTSFPCTASSGLA